MNENTKEMLIIVLGIASAFAAIIGALLLSKEQQLRCINMLKDKPAAEIRVVCK